MAPPFGYWHLGAAALLGFVIGAGLMTKWPLFETYDECVLREMRGQPATVYMAWAVRVCVQRHPDKK
jgi:hypothetical protein